MNVCIDLLIFAKRSTRKTPQRLMRMDDIQETDRTGWEARNETEM